MISLQVTDQPNRFLIGQRTLHDSGLPSDFPTSLIFRLDTRQPPLSFADMERSVEKICAVCSRPGDLFLDCSDIYYCTRSHQEHDWPRHKLVCGKLALLDRRPVYGKIMVLLFPVDDIEPEFVRLPFKYQKWSNSKWPLWGGVSLSKRICLRVNGCSSTCSCDYNTYDSRFTSSSRHTPLCQFIYIGAPEQKDDPSVHDTEILDVNQCIENATGVTSWRGPVIAFAKDSDDRSVDMRALAFNRILDAFQGVRGVRINCDGVVKRHSKPRFEAVTIESYDLRGTIDDAPWNHPGDHNATFLTQHTGIVLQDRRESYAGNPDLSHVDQHNTKATLMSIPCDVNESNFGRYYRRPDTGNVIVVRQDREPLGVQYVEIMCDWLENVLRPLFMETRKICTRVDRGEVPSVPDRASYKRAVRERVFNLITKQNLLAHSGGRLVDENPGDGEEEEDSGYGEDEDTGDGEGEAMADIIDIEDGTDERSDSDARDNGNQRKKRRLGE